MLRIILLILFFCSQLYSQQDFKRWSKVRVSYEIPFSDEVNDTTNARILTGLHKFYKYFISDLDGDNCPFSPSCSNFFIAAYNQTNLLKAALMFSDRFMRDTNIFNRNDYEVNSIGKLIDTPEKYK